MDVAPLALFRASSLISPRGRTDVVVGSLSPPTTRSDASKGVDRVNLHVVWESLNCPLSDEGAS